MLTKYSYIVDSYRHLENLHMNENLCYKGQSFTSRPVPCVADVKHVEDE
jgi:hypothetical protein